MNDPTSFFRLASDCVRLCLEEPPMAEAALLKERGKRDQELSKRRERRRRHKMLPDESDEEAEQVLFGGPLWHVTLPIPSGMLARVFEYSQTHELTFMGVTGRLVGLSGTHAGWVVSVEGHGAGRTGAITGTLSYGSDVEREAATGQWVKCPYGQFQVTRLLPKVDSKPYGCDVSIGATFQRPGLFERLSRSTLERFEINATRARPIVAGSFGRAKTFLLPDIYFAERKPAVEVDSK